MTFPELLEDTIPESLNVVPDPKLAGKHPLHDSRFLATFTKWDDMECPRDGIVVASMRDVLKQRQEALRLVHSRNTLPALYFAVREFLDNDCQDTRIRLHEALFAVHSVE
jgi:hypothetical protein